MIIKVYKNDTFHLALNTDNNPTHVDYVKFIRDVCVLVLGDDAKPKRIFGEQIDEWIKSIMEDDDKI